MDQIGNVSQIENNLLDSSASQIHLSFDHDMFSNYLEPNQNDIFDTRRFTLQQRNSSFLNPATPKVQRHSTPARCKSKASSRATSAKLISRCAYKLISPVPGSQGKLIKRVENLEKKQELWRERASVWDKERKSYQKAIENVNANPANFYRNQLETWKNSRFLKKVSEDISQNPLLELRNMFEWANSQPESTPFKSIKLCFSNILQAITHLENYIETLKKPYERSTLDGNLQALDKKNAELSKNIEKIEEELKTKTQVLHDLEAKMQELNSTVSDKDEEIAALKSYIEDLTFKIDEEKVSETKISNKKVIELQSELEEKGYEIIMARTENKRLSENLQQSQIVSELYIKTIEELKEKLKILRAEAYEKWGSTGLDDKENRKSLSRVKEQFTQTGRKPSRRRHNTDFYTNGQVQDLLAYTSCMATAIEALVNTGN